MRKFLPLLLLVWSISSNAQILDDSTELVYGPQTTKFYFESSIKNNQEQLFFVDTSLYLFERQSLVDRSVRRYQNLGNFGTAAMPVFYEPQAQIGRTSGFNAFTPYSRGSEDRIKFYDTKSPFIDLFAYLGADNKNIVEVDFSRNVRPGWNLGFDIHTITTDKIFANDGEGDRQTESTSFDIYTHYQHQKAPYQAIFYYHDLSHNNIELGGVRFGEDSTIAELFQTNNALLRLDDAQSIRKESQWHLYHDYQVAPQFQVYHVLDSYSEENTYRDFTDGSSGGYDTYLDAYNGVFQIDADSTYERSEFSALSNELGLKGDLSSIFYRAYVKVRSVDFTYFLLDPVERRLETYIGGYARFNWKEKYNIIANGELLQGGEYAFEGKLTSDWINLGYSSKKYNVPFIYGAYFGNHYEWNNDFQPIFSNQVTGELDLAYKWLTFKPTVTLTSLTNFVYFNQLQLPEQASSGIAIASIGGHVNASFVSKKGEGFYIENEVVATNVSGGSADAMRIPELFYNGRYYWRGLLFGDNVPIEIGFDTHARSAYFANAYLPVTQQFHLQDDFEIAGYYKADLFFNMRLDKFYIGLKFTHVDQPADGGFFSTPWYPEHPGGMDLMVRWTFFD